MLSRIELVNSIVALLSIDFHALEQDVKKEQQLKQKVCIFLTVPIAVDPNPFDPYLIGLLNPFPFVILNYGSEVRSLVFIK